MDINFRVTDSVARYKVDTFYLRPGKKNVLVLTTPRKIPSPEFSSLVNHGIGGHLCADMNILGIQFHLVYILVYFCAMTLISIQVESGFLVL